MAHSTGAEIEGSSTCPDLTKVKTEERNGVRERKIKLGERMIEWPMRQEEGGLWGDRVFPADQRFGLWWAEPCRQFPSTQISVYTLYVRARARHAMETEQRSSAGSSIGGSVTPGQGVMMTWHTLWCSKCLCQVTRGDTVGGHGTVDFYRWPLWLVVSWSFRLLLYVEKIKEKSYILA